MGFPSEYKRDFGYKYSHFGTDTNGHDVKAFGDTTGKYFMWDASADALLLAGDFTFTGDLTLTGALGVTGNSQLTGTVTVGVDDTGHDVKLFGATAGSYMLWDESADKLIINAGTADLGTSCEADAYTVGGVAGADFGPADATSFTVVKGIVTAIS